MSNPAVLRLTPIESTTTRATATFGARPVFGGTHVRRHRAGRVLPAVPALVRRRHDPRAQRRLGRGQGRLLVSADPLLDSHAQSEAPSAMAARAAGRRPVSPFRPRLATDA